MTDDLRTGTDPVDGLSPDDTAVEATDGPPADDTAVEATDGPPADDTAVEATDGPPADVTAVEATDGPPADGTVFDEWSIDLDAIVPITGRRPADVADSTLRARRSWTPGVTRRSILRTTVVGATAFGMSVLGVFPPAREALADGYDIDQRGCNGINYRNCKDCCCSTVCRHCCNRKGWHRPRGVYRLRPNQCYAGGGNRSKDGWFWRACSCRKRDGSRGRRVSRCHDGYLISDAGTIRTICRKRMGCK